MDNTSDDVWPLDFPLKSAMSYERDHVDPMRKMVDDIRAADKEDMALKPQYDAILARVGELALHIETRKPEDEGKGKERVVTRGGTPWQGLLSDNSRPGSSGGATAYSGTSGPGLGEGEEPGSDDIEKQPGTSVMGTSVYGAMDEVVRENEARWASIGRGGDGQSFLDWNETTRGSSPTRAQGDFDGAMYMGGGSSDYGGPASADLRKRGRNDTDVSTYVDASSEKRVKPTAVDVEIIPSAGDIQLLLPGEYETPIDWDAAVEAGWIIPLNSSYTQDPLTQESPDEPLNDVLSPELRSVIMQFWDYLVKESDKHADKPATKNKNRKKGWVKPPHHVKQWMAVDRFKGGDLEQTRCARMACVGRRASVRKGKQSLTEACDDCVRMRNPCITTTGWGAGGHLLVLPQQGMSDEKAYAYCLPDVKKVQVVAEEAEESEVEAGDAGEEGDAGAGQVGGSEDTEMSGTGAAEESEVAGDGDEGMGEID
ncbi:hypothetical protein B0A48_04694 [Cryoendolithus antarcticus]|uniref:Uncharacterized protein n=1 Tax=Cryoendolithus antarcticus TaxID=1507870 RepID=A0A1V8TD41_9PEZI|nr:hypothetical protein B0A48_04694 [Cryoendolithus antarcticus]